MSVTRFNI